MHHGLIQKHALMRLNISVFIGGIVNLDDSADGIKKVTTGNQFSNFHLSGTSESQATKFINIKKFSQQWQELHIGGRKNT